MIRRVVVALAAAALVLAAGACGGKDGGATAQPSRSTAQTTGFVPSLTAARAVVWAVGDGADGSAQARALAMRIAADRPDRLLYLGDVYESGTARGVRVPTTGRSTARSTR